MDLLPLHTGKKFRNGLKFKIIRYEENDENATVNVADVDLTVLRSATARTTGQLYLSIYLFIYLTIHLSNYLTHYLSIYLSIYIYIYLSNYTLNKRFGTFSNFY